MTDYQKFDADYLKFFMSLWRASTTFLVFFIVAGGTGEFSYAASNAVPSKEQYDACKKSIFAKTRECLRIAEIYEKSEATGDSSPIAKDPSVQSKSPQTNSSSTPIQTARANDFTPLDNPLDKGKENTSKNKETIDGGLKASENDIKSGLGAIKARIAEKEKHTPNMSPSELENYYEDRQIVKTADDLLKNKNSIPEELAEMANDKVIHDNLLLVSLSQGTQKDFAKESSRLAAQIAELARLASIAATRGTNMGSIKEANQKLASNTNAPEEDSLVTEQQIAELAKEEGKDPKKLTEKARAAIIAKLKDRIRKKMADAAKKEAQEAAAKKAEALAAANKQFDGKLGAELADNGEGAQNTKDAGVGAVDAMLKAASQFSLAGAETDASVRQIMSDAERQLASNEDRSIQSAESPTLFERVKAAHKSCVSHGCVRTN